MEPTAPLPSDLHREEETWQGEVFNVGEAEHPCWLVWVTCPDWDLILAHSVCDVEPNSERMLETLVRAMQEDPRDEPHRPTRSLKLRLKEFSIKLVEAKELDAVDGVPELINEVYVASLKEHGHEHL